MMKRTTQPEQPEPRQQAKSHDGLSVGEQVIWQKDPGVQQLGEVVGIENDEGTYLRVKLDDGKEKVLTFEELMRA